ncbi:unnamed protein product [Rotaria sp. Silwood1]|nr:unnamed protein product [Rotaria sp. Silwood1]
MFYEDAQRHLPFDRVQSSKTSSSSLSNDPLHNWLFIIGLVTSVLFVLLLCIQCILKICRHYRSIDCKKQTPISRINSSRQSLPYIDNNSNRLNYRKIQCSKSTNSTQQILNKYSNHKRIQNINHSISHPDQVSLIPVHVV